ncbi:MAG: hypothetical protein FJ319_00305 [SAR202 cluster bacterium]|nr:hypothetical protein [SAR202 cluster bacterium]
MTFRPADQDARDAIRDCLDDTLFVEAGAGTGKTSSLVERLAALVSSGKATIDRVAAITFTDAAAAELRDRVRERLERATKDDTKPERERARCRQGVLDLDRASIQTLHSFAAALLSERPLEAGLPPSFDKLDEIEADIDFEERWAEWLEDALDDPALEPALAAALSLDITLEHLHTIARGFHREYDRLAASEFAPAAAPTPAAVPRLLAEAGEIERLCRFALKGDADPLVAHCAGVLASARRLAGMSPSQPAALRLLNRTLPFAAAKKGNQKEFETDRLTGQNACKALKALLADLDEAVRQEIEAARRAALMPLLRALQGFVLQHASERRQAGRAEFHDLLVWARDLLRDSLDARDHFRSHFSHLLIDEAQDTDTIQAEIAFFIAEEAPGAAPDSRPRDWTSVTPAPGKLFVVGDPKQSIYRFRRADVTQLSAIQARMGGRKLELKQNFRSQRPATEWVNHLFGQWMTTGDGQATYVPLVHRWEPDPAHPRSAAVWALGGESDLKTVDAVRRQEAEEIAALIRTVRSEGWPVLDKDSSVEEAVYRPAAYRDICILIPTRTGLRTLELALEDARVPFRLEGASLIFNTQVVRDILSCLRAIDDPTDRIALVGALRSPAFACSDVDLLAHVDSGSALDYLSPPQPGAPATVAEALLALRGYHERRMWTTIPALIDAFVRDRRLLEASMSQARPREQWRRYRFLVEQARAFVSAGGTSLRAFLQWIDRRMEEGARVTETPVPESDEDAVRIMTVHASKGLEFPVVILTALNADRKSRVEPVLADRAGGGLEVCIGEKDTAFETAGFKILAELEKRMEDLEFVRLMYVAATRARDHLVVSVHRKAGDEKSAAATIASKFKDAPALWRPVPVECLSPASAWPQALLGQPVEEAGTVTSHTTLSDRAAWLTAHEALIAARSRPLAVAATTLAQEARADRPDDPEQPWRRGRAGTNIGRAVHAVLQTVDLATGEGLDAAVAAQATAEGVPHRRGEIALLARAALESEAVRRAVASSRTWREAPVAAPVGGGVLEGFIDLLFEEDGCLIVVDYKTDWVQDVQSAQSLVQSRYRLQAGAYALALRQVTGMPVKEVVFLFLHLRNGEVSLTDIDALAAEAEAGAKACLGGASATSVG